MDRLMRQKGRSGKEKRHVRLYHWLLQTPAWKSLSPNARSIYVEMLTRYAGPNSNNGRIPFSYRDGAKRLGIGKNAVSAAFVALRERGFIVQTKKGGFNVKTKNLANEWRLTEYPSDIDNTAATKDFMKWPPPTAIQNTGTVAGQYGSCSGTPVAEM
jgi:hypothetical protein